MFMGEVRFFMPKFYFTSESVTSGHPDKVCDLIADSILDEALRQDPTSHMAVEATIKDDLILVYGEAGTNAVIDYEKIAHTFRSSVFSAFFLYFSFLVFYFTFCSGVCKRGGEWFRMAVDRPCIF